MDQSYNKWKWTTLLCYILFAHVLKIAVPLCRYSYGITVKSSILPRKNTLYSRKDLKDLFDSLGERKLLNEFSQYIGKGSNPMVEWVNYTTIKISLGDSDLLTYDYVISAQQGSSIVTSKQRKEVEYEAIRNVLDRIVDTPLNGQLASYVSKRLNRDNVPTKISRSGVMKIAATKPMLILIDVENVPDFRKCFYISKEGQVRFAFPSPPPILTAPSIFVDSGGSVSSTTSRQNDAFEDDDLLILTYAHAKGPQSILANRVTIDNGKDAADALIMFDLGALQLLSNIQKIILVTDDHFGGAAKGCFADDTLTDVFQDISTITSNTISKYSAVDFQVVPNCLSAARLVGRLWF